MFVVDSVTGLVGLTRSPEDWGRRDIPLKEVRWRVFGDDLANVSVDGLDHIENVSDGEWVIQDGHRPYSDLVQVRGLRAVIIEGIPANEGFSVDVVLDPEMIDEENRAGFSARGGELISQITDADTPVEIDLTDGGDSDDGSDSGTNGGDSGGDSGGGTGGDSGSDDSFDDGTNGDGEERVGPVLVDRNTEELLILAGAAGVALIVLRELLG